MRDIPFEFRSRRSAVLAERGACAASHPLAAQAGLNILRRGGNAADAAIASAAVMNVVAPHSTGIGGDCFALYYDASTGQISAMNGSGAAPAALSLEFLASKGIIEALPERSIHTVTVPGAAAGWADLLARHGTMSLADVLQDAIHYAENGFHTSPVYGQAWQDAEALLKSKPFTEDYLPQGRAPRVGQKVRLLGLALTFRLVAEGGAQAFYEGPIAEAIVHTVQELGGLMTLDDLKAHRTTWEQAISSDYRGVTVVEHPPNGQGLAALQALNIVEGFNLAQYGHDDPRKHHLMIEAMRLAFADARQYIADPARQAVNVAGLLDKGYAAARRAFIRPDRAMQPPSFGAPPTHSDTIYLCTVDAQGNACSFINSLYMGFGSGVVAQGTGVFLQNRGANFSLDAGHPNALAGGKRPYHTIIPGMLLRQGAFYAAFGIMGGFNQPQAHMQAVNALVDDQLDPQSTLDRPRWCLLDGSADSVLAVEDGFSVSMMAELARLGHRVRPVSGYERGLFGGGHILLRHPETGALWGGSDPRHDGLVAAY